MLPRRAKKLFRFLEGLFDVHERGERRSVCAVGDRGVAYVFEQALRGPGQGLSLNEGSDGVGVADLVKRKGQQRGFDRRHILTALSSHLGYDWSRLANDASHRAHRMIRHSGAMRDQGMGREPYTNKAIKLSGLLSHALIGQVLACLFGIAMRDPPGERHGDHCPEELRPGGNAIVDLNRVQQLRSEAAKLEVQMRLPRLIAGTSTPKRGLAQLLGAIALMFATPALADPCKAIPDRGPLPPYLSRGATFSGPVSYVGDGDSLCVEVGRGPSSWVEVRVADFYAPELNAPGGREAKAALERVTRGKRAVCTAGHRSYDRIVANCRIGGVSISELMRRQGISEGGNGR